MKLEALNKETHKNLRFKKVSKYTMPYAPIAAREMAACSLKFPIVITQEEAPRLVALLGQSKNVLIDDDFDGYVPFAVQNYPFVLAQNEDNEKFLCIDAEAPDFKSGKELFKVGKESDFLAQIIENTKEFSEDEDRTKNALKEMKDAGILEPKELTIGEENRALISGFYVVDREKLDKLDDKTLADFARRGYLELIYTHLQSLSNLQILTDAIVEKELKTE
ncbi:MAG: SapC family protein [Campylobacter sp.]